MTDDTPIHDETLPTTEPTAQQPAAPDAPPRRTPAHLSASFATLDAAAEGADAAAPAQASTQDAASIPAEAEAEAEAATGELPRAQEPAPGAETEQGQPDDPAAPQGAAAADDDPATEELPRAHEAGDSPTTQLGEGVAGLGETSPHEPTVESTPVVLSHGRRLPRMLQALVDRIVPARDSHARVMAACVVLIALGVIAAAALSLVPKTHRPVPALISVSAPNLGADGSPVPVHVTGADIDGAVVDRTEYLTAGNHELELVPGGYTVTVLASPLVPSGTLYVIDGIAARLDVSEFEFGDGNGHGSASLTLGIAGVEQMTDEAIDAARSYALASGMGEGSVQRLVDATVAHRIALLPATYSFEYASADDLHKGKLDGKPDSNDGIKAWYAYPVFTSSKDNEDMDRLNDKLRSAAETAARSTTGSGLFGSSGSALYHARVTYFAGGVAALRIESWGSDSGGNAKVEAQTWDLDTGTSYEPWEFVGLTRAELNACAIDAVESYLKAQGGTSGSDSDSQKKDSDDWIDQTNRWLEDLFRDTRTPRERAKNLVELGNVTYYVTADGVVASLPTEALGISSKKLKGSKVLTDLLVCDLSGQGRADGVAFEPTDPPATTMTGKQP